MIRKLSYAMLLSLSAASSPQASALGTGDVEIHSFLNAPLRAVLPLTDTTGLDPERLRVSVAEPREFAAAGLARTPVAASVRADVEMRQGQWVVALFSERPIREPWLELLLRFDSPSGRHLHQATLLFDPPEYHNMPVLVSGSQRQSEPMGRPGATGPDPVPEAGSLSAAASASATQAQDSAWIATGDTLWVVAERLRPDSSLSVSQMMVALAEANPDIFPSGDINSMRAGHTLHVPSREIIASRSAAEAERLVQAMNQAWASRDSGTPARVPPSSMDPAGQRIDIAAVDAAQAATQPTTPPADEPFLQEPGAQQSGETPLVDEQADAAPRLTLLSDAELAGEAAEGRLDREVLAALDAGELALTAADSQSALLEQRWQESRAALGEVQAERDVLQQELSELHEENGTLREQLSALLSASGNAERGGSASTQFDANGQADAPWWGAMTPEPFDRRLLLGGVGLAALLGLWLWLRQRREASMARAASAMPNVIHGRPLASPANASAAQVSPLAAGVLVDDARPPGEKAVDRAMPQAEAISEADIYMAYGRFDQARELLEAGLARGPERHELRLKLLQVHKEQGNWQAAEHEAQVLAETGDTTLMAEAGRLLARRPSSASVRSMAVPASALPDSVPPELATAPEGLDEVEKGHEEAREAIVFHDRDAEGAVAGDERETNIHGEGLLKESVVRIENVVRIESEAEAGPALPGEDATRTEALPEESPLRQETSEADRGETGTPARQEPVERDMIDYQPPALDPEPAPRVETPMQPSIEFPLLDDTPGDPTAQGAPALGDQPREPNPFRRDEPEEMQWEVEEVVFPPLERDNDATLDGLAQRDELDRRGN